MNKLFKLRKWLTVSEAADHLTRSLKELVTEADIYRLGLEGHLTLSVDLIHHANAHVGVLIPLSKAKKITGLPSISDKDKLIDLILGVRVGDDKIIQFDEYEKDRNVVSLSGVYDLAMIGAERFDCEARFQALTGGIPVELISLDGTFVQNHDKSHYYSILEVLTPQKVEKDTYKIIPPTYMPANGLPDDSVIVVRTASIKAFEESLNEIEEDTLSKPLGNRERRTLLTIIAAVCKEAKLDIKTHSKTANLIHDLTVKMGVEVSESAIEDHLKKIPDALETRMK